MKRCNSISSASMVMHERGEAYHRPAKWRKARGCSTALEHHQQQHQQQQQYAQDFQWNGEHVAPTSRTALLEMLHLIQTVNRVSSLCASMEALGSTVPAAALPAALAAAHTSLTACERAVALGTALLEANSPNLQLMEKALMVAEAAVAAACRRLSLVKQYVTALHQEQQPQQQVVAEYEDDELADTCSSAACFMQVLCSS